MNTEILQIHLNSRNADIYHNNMFSDSEWYLPIIEVPLQYTIYISVQHAVIPYSFYNINDSNNILNYQIGLNILSVIIPIGN